MTEVSDKVEVRGRAGLSSYESEEGRGYQAKPLSMEHLKFFRLFELRLGEMAASAGYQPGDVFDYTITVPNKK